MKRILFTTIVFSALFFLSNVISAQSNTPTIRVPHVTGKIGDIVNVPIKIENNPGIISMRLYLDYNPNKLQLIKVNNGGLLGSSTHGNNLSMRPYRLYWYDDDTQINIKENGDMGVLQFRIIEEATATPIEITYDFDDGDILNFNLQSVYFDVVNGSVTSESVVIPTIRVPHVTGKIGESVNVPIEIENNPGIISMRLYLDYDPNKLELIKVNNGGLLGSSTHGNNLSGRPYRLYWYDDDTQIDIKDNGEMGVLQFRIKEEATATPIEITYDFDDGDILNFNLQSVYFDVVNGSVTSEAAAQTYTVMWNVDGGTPAPSQTSVNHGGTINVPDAMTKTGYTFDRWYSDVDLTAPVTFPINNVTDNHAFWAQWNIITYNITYVLNGGTNHDDNPATYTIESPTINLQNPTRDGYTFVKWTEGSSITAGSTGEKTFTAEWTINNYTVTFKIVNGTWDGTDATDKTEQVAHGAKPTIPTGMLPAAGYSATGNWNTDPDVAVTGDVTYTYTFGAKQTYTVTYKIVNGTWEDNTAADKTETVTHGEKPAAIPTGMNPAGGYTNEGSWNTNPDVAVTGDVTYTYTFGAKQTYTVIWKGDDGTTLGTEEYNYGTTPSYKGDTPTKTATGEFTYAFTGWDPAIVNVTANATYTAQFSSTNVKYTVTWKGDDGTTLDTEEYNYGDTPSYKGYTPTKTATGEFTYAFTGWDPAIVAVTADATYTAQFTATNAKYTVTWKDDKDEVLGTEEYNYGTTPSYKGDTPTKTATAEFTYAFTGWDPTITPVTGPATYTAQFSSVTNQYTVTYKIVNGTWGDGLNTDKTETVSYGSTPASIPTNMSPNAGYTNLGSWGDVTPGGAITGDVTYTFTFGTRIEFTVTFADGDGNIVANLTIENVPYGMDITLPAPLTSTGKYNYTGWNHDGKNITGNLTINALYTINTYIVKWNANGGTPEPTQITVDYDGTISVPGPMNKTGHSFDGWFADALFDTPVVAFPIENVTSNQEFWAKWTANIYKVTFNPDGGAYTGELEQFIEHGRTATAPTVERDLYDFSGWYNGDVLFNLTTPITSDLTLTAKWTLKPTYSISASPDNHSFGSLQVGYTTAPAFQTVTITNTGTGNVTITTPAVMTGSAFTISNATNFGTSRTPGQTATFRIQPRTTLGVGIHNETITITGTNGAIATVDVSFEVVAGSISVSPNVLSFGTLATPYTQPAAQTVTIANTGTAAITIIQPTASSNYTIGNLSRTSLTTSGNNSSATFSVRPIAGLGVGVYNETITINTNSGTSATIEVKFEVIATTYSISVSPDNFSFGTRQTGYTATALTTQTFTIANTGSAAITLTQPTSTNFTIGNLSRTSLTTSGGNSSATFTVRPNIGLPVGIYNETITVLGSNGASTTVDVSFEVTSGPTYKISASPDNISFGSRQTGYTQPAAMTVTITNIGTEAVTLTRSTLAGFTISALSNTGSRAAGTTTTFTIRPNAGLSAGIYEGEITITGTNGGNVTNTTVKIYFEVTSGPTYKIAASPESLSFGSLLTPYTRPSPKTVTITNTGTQSIALTRPTATNYEIGPLPVATITAGQTASFTVRPLGSLPVGNYDETITVNGSDGSSTTVDLKFEVITKSFYTVTFDLNDGTHVGGGALEQSIEHGSNAVAPDVKREGYTFDGWDKALTNVTDNMTVTAQWKINTYTVAVSANPTTGGIVNGGGTAIEHDTNVTVDATANAGYTFVNWTEDGAEVHNEATYNFTATGSRTLVANFMPNAYTVTYRVVNGTWNDNTDTDIIETVTHGEKPTSIPTGMVPALGFTVSGNWNSDPDVATTSDVTFTYTFGTQSTYTVTFKDGDGNDVPGLTISDVAYGTDITLPTTLTGTDKFTYTGWDHDGLNITGNTVINATYTINTYTVTFVDGEGNTVDELTVTDVPYGTDITLPEKLANIGKYVYTGWDHDGTNITGNTVINATFDTQTYTVTFKDGDGNTVDELTVTDVPYGTDIVLPATLNPTAKYNYTGWDHEGKNITGNTVINATFDIQTYTVTYKVVNGTWSDGLSADKTETVAYGAASTSVPTGMIPGTGYTGSGSWDVTPGAAITGNVTYTYTFGTPKQYTIEVSANPTVGGDVTGGGVFNHLESVTVTATAKTGYQFVNWTEDGVVVSSNATYTFNIEGNRTLVANFTQISTRKPGDVNGDGVIDFDDILAVLDHYNGIYLLTGDKFLAADINDDGVIDFDDILAILDHYNGIKLLW